MAKRRNILIGMGAMAVGSGVITAASFSDETELGDADFRIVAAANLMVRRGDDSAYDTDFNFESIDNQDVPKAYANEENNADLEVKLARRNNAAEQSFAHLLEIENQDIESHNIGVKFTNLGQDVDENSSSEHVWTPARNDGDFTDDEDLTAGDVAEIFKFMADPGGENQQISPDTGDSDPAGYISISPAETVTVDLVTDQESEQVKAVNHKAAAGTEDGAFAGPADPDPIDLLDNVTVGIEETP